MDNLSIGEAVTALKLGHAVARENWNGADQYLELQVPDKKSKMTKPYVYINTVQGDKIPWVASPSDLLAEDWHIVE